MAKAMISLNDACELKELALPQWILEYDINPGARINSPAAERFRLRFDYRDHAGISCTCWPDAGCLLTFNSDKKDWNLALCWEYDRSTEGHSQIASKMPGYEKLLASDSLKLLWPQMQGLRIFFVLQSMQRLQNVCRTICHSSAVPYVRLSTAKEVMNPARILTAPIWRTVGENGEPGENRSILPS